MAVLTEDVVRDFIDIKGGWPMCQSCEGMMGEVFWAGVRGGYNGSDHLVLCVGCAESISVGLLADVSQMREGVSADARRAMGVEWWRTVARRTRTEMRRAMRLVAALGPPP